MEQRLINFLHGYVRICITGSSWDRFLNLCAFHGIRLWDLVPSGNSFEASITKSDFRRLRAIVKKSHTRVRITNRYGLPFFIHRYRKRQAYVVGIAAACIFMAWLSAHIWNIRIEGNLSQTDDVIFEYLENVGIRHGVWKSQVDTQLLSQEIRSYFSQFSWVSAELEGTRLIIYVKEGISDTENLSAEDTAPSSLSASRSGTVLSVYVRRGLPVVSAGDTVEEGDLLVTGALPVYNDDGEISSWQEVCADADIVIQTELSYYDELSFDMLLKHYTGREKTTYMIRVGALPFSLPASFDEFADYDLTGRITQVRLSENFYLPLYLYQYTAKEYETLQYTCTKEQAEQILMANLHFFIEKLEEKGLQIFENDVTIEWYENSAIASGSLITGENAVRRTAVEYTDALQEEE